MRREERAKQFLPFDAMKGLAAAMRREEERATRVDRIELGEEDAALLSSALSHIRRGEAISVTYYDGGHYRTLCGQVTEMDEIRRILKVGATSIPFDDVTALDAPKP